MRRFEPGVLDLHGAEWTSPTEYRMYPGAVRYEQYEKSFAAQVFDLLKMIMPPLGLSAMPSLVQILIQQACGHAKL